MKYFPVLSLVALIAILISSCGGNKEVKSKKFGDNSVTIHELGNPQKILPILSTGASSTYVEGNIFQTLLGSDPVTYELQPALAKARPIKTPITSGPLKGGMTLEYEIREGAVWDNGTPITGYDYLFTMKSIKNPKVDCLHLRPYMEFIADIVVDKKNPKKFTVYSADTYILGEEFASYWVLPEYNYDPKKLMRKFTIKQLNDPKQTEKLKSNKDIIQFATEFNSEQFSREAGFVVGSGPYEFKEWVTGQYIVLEKKKNWWGDKYPDLTNKPDKIIYQIITDWTTAITAMKDEEIDCARSIKAKDFMDLKESDRFNKLYSLHTPDFMSYDYIGMNMKSKIFRDKNTRKAMCHLVDKKQIIDILMYGMGQPTQSPFHPTKSYYHKNLSKRSFNINKAKSMLTKNGWKDSDGDGILDKVIDGVKTPFKVVIKYNQGNDRRQNIALMLKENARKIGIDIEVEVREWTLFIEETKKHNFDMYVGGWVGGTGLTDPKQIWHSDSYNGGSNYVGFGTQQSDDIIERIRYEQDEKERDALYIKLQELIHEDAPYIFLNAPKNRLAFHKRFNNAKAYVPRPGYNETEWVLNPVWNPAKKMESN